MPLPSDTRRAAVDRTADSFAVRDFDGEHAALMRKAAVLREQSAALDLDSAVEAALSSVGSAAETAMQTSDSLAEGTRARLAEQQERFKAGILSQGRSLEEELEEHETLSGSASSQAASTSNVAGNKYAALMNRKKHVQEQQKISGA